jgi:hypothetical protein
VKRHCEGKIKEIYYTAQDVTVGRDKVSPQPIFSYIPDMSYRFK